MKTFTHAHLDDPDIFDDGPWFYLEFQTPKYCSVCQSCVPNMHLTLPGGYTAIIIFNEHDDPILLHSAALWQKLDTTPRISEYEPDLGLSIPIEEVCKILGHDYQSVYEAISE